MKKKKILIPIFSVAAVASVVAPIAVIAATRKSNSNIEKKATHDAINNENIFPSISSSQFYEYIQIEDGKPVFDKNIFTAVYKYVVSSLQSNVEKIDFDYEFKTKSKLVIKFIAYNQDNTYTHEYTLEAK
ncbi:hypothetical protein E1I18_02240 [Mycoplasmopsis mucosicanis]|uniref:Uncharacterized protein n=1 Tax=Mycoplasmopsis mucosicanis TaxID=458208 RepID=A0A507SN70_9BACT|nr:hypothetical protein [Mycoplasmopsis mucosicanis]TQC51484.1 hypothetical protein E1I18_02240 [Mycoplasmopsis mucosicanis]